MNEYIVLGIRNQTVAEYKEIINSYKHHNKVFQQVIAIDEDRCNTYQQRNRQNVGNRH